MSTARQLSRVSQLPPPHPGQFGPAHTVVEVITPRQWADADPFILLMDDRVDGVMAAGPHPHAGFETVSFLVEGSMAAEGDGEKALSPGDVEWTTAGSGMIHGEVPTGPIRMRLLQLWLTLPKKDRWTAPDQQLIPKEDALVRSEPGATARLYSGRSGSLTSTTRNRVPVNLVDVRLEPGASIEQEIPNSHNGFLYVLEGEARIGTLQTALTTSQVGWLDRPANPGDGTLLIAQSGEKPLRVLVYTGERQNDPIVWYGPFVGDSPEDINRSFEGYRAGAFKRF